MSQYNPYNRTMYDECEYSKYVEQSSAHLKYQIYPSKYINCSSTCDKKHNSCGTDKQMNNKAEINMSDRIDLEQHLTGRSKKPKCAKDISLKDMHTKIDRNSLPKDLCTVTPSRQKLNTYNINHMECN
jgi:hypothetical protein